MGFYNPKEDEARIIRVDPQEKTKWQLPDLYVPRQCHQRTLYCWLKREDDEARGIVERAIASWNREMKLTLQSGHVGLVSPSPQRSQRSSRGGPSSHEAGASATGAYGKASRAKRALCETLPPVIEGSGDLSCEQAGHDSASDDGSELDGSQRQ